MLDNRHIMIRGENVTTFSKEKCWIYLLNFSDVNDFKNEVCGDASLPLSLLRPQLL
jgi:hypothetical protein